MNLITHQYLRRKKYRQWVFTSLDLPLQKTLSHKQRLLIPVISLSSLHRRTAVSWCSRDPPQGQHMGQWTSPVFSPDFKRRFSTKLLSKSGTISKWETVNMYSFLECLSQLDKNFILFSADLAFHMRLYNMNKFRYRFLSHYTKFHQLCSLCFKPSNNLLCASRYILPVLCGNILSCKCIQDLFS